MAIGARVLMFQLLDTLALGGGQRIEKGLVVVGVVPDGADGVGLSVDEELVVGFGVVGAYPAWRERAELVFHAKAGWGWDAVVSVPMVVVAGDVEEVVGVEVGLLAAAARSRS